MKFIKLFLLIYITLILVVVFTTGCSQANSEIENAKETGERKTEPKPFTWKEEINGLHLGMTVNEVKNILGKPLEELHITSESEGEVTIIKYQNSTLTFNHKLGINLSKIVIEGNGSNTVRGIKIGDNVEVLNNKFYLEEIKLSNDKKDVGNDSGKAKIYYYENKDRYTVTYYDPNYNYIALIFEINDNRIVKTTLIYQTV